MNETLFRILNNEGYNFYIQKEFDADYLIINSTGFTDNADFDMEASIKKTYKTFELIKEFYPNAQEVFSEHFLKIKL